MKRCFLIFWFLYLCVAGGLHASADVLEDVLEDICNQLAEEGEFPLEELQEELLEIAAHPINLNQTNAAELSRLRFLSDEQIDAILLQQYEQPFQSVYDLLLVTSLKDYDIRNLLPFVYVGEAEDEQKMYIREVFHYAKHELTLRADVRNVEDYEGDPVYGKLRYRFNYQNRVQAGFTVSRAPGGLWQDVGYGGYVQLRDIGPMKSIVAGNYQASFGYGLVMGSPFRRGKNSYVESTSITDEGIKKFSSVGDSYRHFHGLGATGSVGPVDVSGFYSVQQDKDAIWHHVVGANATMRWKRWKLGVSAIENIYSGDNDAQAVVGINARWNIGKVDLWGEVAASQGVPWGWATIMGIRYAPISGLNLLGIYRYYSPEYDNMYANALSSKTRINNEHGGYLGVEYNGLKNWQLRVLGDLWQSGYEAMAEADFLPPKDYQMHMRFRAKRKDAKDTYALRWKMVNQLGGWTLKTQADGNLVHDDGRLTYGWSVYQDVEYRFLSVPIVLQLRVQAFDARQWDNRVYIYENDVLYAYSIPFVYGLGGRFWLNARYGINDILSLYLRISETVYQAAWANTHDKKTTRTDIHALLRVKL